MENKMKKPSLWDWIVIISCALLVLLGLVIWNSSSIGLLAWGLVVGYIKLRKMGIIKDIPKT